MCFLGSQRRTVDFDCTVEISSIEFETTVEAIAQELHVEVEIIPIDKFFHYPLQLVIVTNLWVNLEILRFSSLILIASR